MSQWTHVNGSIRIDHLKVMSDYTDLNSKFKTCGFTDDEIEWKECNVPCGSEGSIQVNIWENPEDHHLAAYTVNFWGDLRDYDNEQELVDWFTKIIKSHMIRDAVMSIRIEYQSYSVYVSQYDEKTNENNVVCIHKEIFK